MRIKEIGPSMLVALALCARAAHAGDERDPLEAAVSASGCSPSEAVARDRAEGGRDCTDRAAYRLNDSVTVEGIHESIGDFGTRTRTSADAIDSGDVRTESFTLNGKLVASLGRLRSYLSGGVGLLHANGDLRIAGTRIDANGLNFAGRFGGGLDLRATEHISLFVDTAYTMGGNAIGEARDFNLGWGARYAF